MSKMEYTQLAQDNDTQVPTEIQQSFSELFEAESTDFENTTPPSDVESIASPGDLVLDCDTTCPLDSSNFYIGAIWENGVRNQWGPFRAPFRAIIIGGCNEAKVVAFLCGNQPTGPFRVRVNSCYAKVFVCRCA